MDCPRPIKSVLPRFYPTWSSRTGSSMRIQRSEGPGSRLVYRKLAIRVTPYPIKKNPGETWEHVALGKVG